VKRIALAIALLASFPIAAHAQALAVGNGSFSSTIAAGGNPAGAMGTGGSTNSLGAIGLGGNPNGAVGRGLTSVPFRSHVWIGMSGDNLPGFNVIWGSSWAKFAQWVDMVQIGSPSTYATTAHAAGIKVDGYNDSNLCSGITYPVGANSVANPDFSGAGVASFYHDGSNNELQTSNNNLVLAKICDPTQSTVQAIAAAAAALQIDDDAIQEDDATIPNPSTLPFPEGWGTPTTWVPGSNSFQCSASPGGCATSGQVNLTSWSAGEATMVNGLGKPVMLNGYGAEMQTVLAAMNPTHVWGLMLEEQYCRDDNAFLTGGANMVQYTSNYLFAVSHGFNMLFLCGENGRDATAPVRVGEIARIMLGYDYNHVYETNYGCGTSSMVSACQEAGLVFLSPLLGYPSSVSSLEVASGTMMVREFAHCEFEGTDEGACAAVANYDSFSAHPIPTLSGTYSHVLVLSGGSLCNCHGDGASTIAFNGALPSTIPPGGATVLFP